MKKKVLVVGDAIMDRYVHGVTNRLSPEAPTAVLDVQYEDRVPGGAANVAMNAAAQDVQVGLLYLRGTTALDREADHLQNLLGGHGVWAHGHVLPGHRVPLKTRFMAAGQQLLRCDEEFEPPGTGAARMAGGRVVEEFNQLLPEVGVLVLSDYGKGMFAYSVACNLISAARANPDAHVPIVVAPRGSWEARYKGVDVLVVSWEEARKFCAGEHHHFNAGEGESNTARAMAEIVAQKVLPRHVVITCGPAGAHWYEVGPADPLAGEHHTVHAKARAVADTTGAGDTFLGVLAAELLRNPNDFAEAVIRANAAAGVAVSKPGTAVVRRLEVEEDLGWKNTGARKVNAIQSAAAVAERYKANGRKVGFVFGEYHQLRPGHVRFLRDAREECDFLIVGVVEDKKTYADAMPAAYQAFDERLEVMAEVESADLVVPVPDDDVEAVVRELRPDIIFVTERHEGGKAADVVADRGGVVRVKPRR